jgi:hypothetical protein
MQARSYNAGRVSDSLERNKVTTLHRACHIVLATVANQVGVAIGLAVHPALQHVFAAAWSCGHLYKCRPG